MRVFLCLAIVALLAGCSAVERPVGAGSGRDELPASPCACGEPFYTGGVWL